MRLVAERPYLSCLHPDMKKHELVQQITISSAAHGERLSPSKIDKLAKQYKREVILSQTAPVTTYRDPTGEAAVYNVMHEKKNPTQPASTRGVLSIKNHLSSYERAK